MPCYEHFVTLQKSVFVPLVFFRLSHLGTGLYYINSTALPVCDNHRINRHKVFADLAQRGKTSMGWFFGFKLHLVFNNDNEIVALKLTPGNVHDTTAVPALTRDLIGKLFGDKGYIGRKLAEDLLRRGLTLFTRVRRNMKSLPMSLQDKALLNARNMAETQPDQGVLVPQSVQASIRHQCLHSHHRGHHRLPDQPVQAKAQPSAPLSSPNHSLKTPIGVNLFRTQVGLGPEGAGDHGAIDRFRESPFTVRPPPKQPNAERCSREHLTPAEIERLVAAAQRLGRHGHRDATMILLAYRHGLRVSGLVSLRREQVDLRLGLLHVRRRKNGLPSTHPLRGPEIRALRKLTLPRQTGPDVKFGNHLEEGHDKEDAETVHGRVQGCGGCPAG